MRFTLWLLAVALVATSRSAAAQVSVIPVRDLAFGPVIVGVPTQIPPSHPVRSGQFRLTAPPQTRMRFRLTLPNRLDGPAGATLPISFNNTDGIVVGTAPNSVPETFNPKATKIFEDAASTTIHVFIGGTVSPAGNQPPGNYTGTITFTVTIF
ncbi:MAG: DUF4402 domain-containing protein [Gemmatimonadales bacterium]